MVKTSGELEREFIESSQERTGRSLGQWLDLVQASGIVNRLDIMTWLKRGHGLNHMQAQFVTGIFKNDGRPVYNDVGRMDLHFSWSMHLRPAFDELSAKIISQFPGTQVIPRKTHLSFTAVREFAAVSINPKVIRLALDLGDQPFGDILEKSTVKGLMQRFTHMITFTESRPPDMAFVQASYHRTHSG